MNTKEIANLYWFCQSVVHGGFTNTSQALGVSPPTLSRALTQLEDSLGEKLVHRNAKQFRLTTAGQEYYQRFSPLFSQLDEQWLQLSNSQPSLTGDIRISCPEPFADYFLQDLAIDFMAQNPGVNIIIRFSSDAARFVEDRTDLAITITPPTTPNLVQRQLFNLEQRLAASPAYLEQFGEPERVEQLMERHLVAGDTNPAWVFQQGAKEIKIPLKPHYFINSLRLATQAMCAGAGIGLLPKDTLAPLLARGQLVHILRSVQCPRRISYMVWADRKLEPARVTVLRELILKRVGEQLTAFEKLSDQMRG